MRLLITFLFLLGCLNATAQERVLDSLKLAVQKSSNEEQKINALNNLANYYYGLKQFQTGDSVNDRQLFMAELTNSEDLIIKTYFHNDRTTVSDWSSTASLNKTLEFINKGIAFAKSVNNADYVAVGYARMAEILRKKNDLNEAVQYAMKAVGEIQHIRSDSIKAVVNIQLGDCYFTRKQSVDACKSYNNAFVIALKIENNVLESTVYHRLADLYYILGDKSEAKSQLLKSLSINKASKNKEGLLWDYVELARVTDDSLYVNEAIFLADSLHITKYNMRIKNIMYAILLVNKEVRKAINYLNNDSELKAMFTNAGIGNYYFQIGYIFRYADQPDSALYYFKLAEPDMLQNMSLDQVLYVHMESAACYGMKGDRVNEIKSYETTLQYAMQTGTVSIRAMISDSLSRLYNLVGDYKKAYDMKLMATVTKDSLALLSKEREIALLDVDRESQKMQTELLREQEQARNKKNIQYMGITIAICVVFILMLILGAFVVSKLTIKIMGYFFFISLFEFIVMWLDNEIIHYFTHGEPLKLWIIKICLIGCLVPIQQLLEHRVIHFLESRKLLKARKFSFRKLWGGQKKSKRASGHLHVAEKEKAVFSGEGDAPAGVL